MNKIIYLKYKKEVSMGDTIEIEGIHFTITQRFIDDNPQLFAIKDNIPEYVECIKLVSGNESPAIGDILPVEKSSHHNQNDWISGVCIVGSYSYNHCFKSSTKEAYDKQELLKEAKDKYPIGTIIVGAMYNSDQFKYSGEGLIINELGISYYLDSSGWIYLLHNGEWAEIIPDRKPLFTTEDGVDKFEGDRVVIVYNSFRIAEKDDGWLMHWEPTNDTKAYHSFELAKAYVEANKPKELLDYQLMLDTGETVEIGWEDVDIDDYYSFMQAKDPKSYWTIVLQLIADDLNDKFNGNAYHRIELFNGEYNTDWYNSKKFSDGGVRFSSKDIAYKAIKIMGDKLDFIYKS